VDPTASWPLPCGIYHFPLYRTKRRPVYLTYPQICSRPPTTDTYSLPQSQEEFYFSLPYDKMDLCLWSKNHDVPAEEVGELLGLSAEQVERVYRDIEGKRKVTRYLGCPPLLIVPI
jgi:NAD+ synthase